MSDYAVNLADVRDAAARIAPLAHRTPVVTCATLDRLAGRRLFFKCEQLQKVGAFKFRGALNAVLKLSDEAASRGVVTHSSGNHAQALALAAQLRGVAAHIVMPSNSSPVKRRAVEEYGARVVVCAPTLAAREEMAAAVQTETGATFVHPYDHPDIIAGQGTAALELLNQVDQIAALIVPVGGGGLIAGTCAAVKALRPDVRIFAAEPLGANDAARSKAAGTWLPQIGPQTIADGLRTSLGRLTWPYIRDQVEDVITVSDEEIVTAMRLAWERGKLLVEPSAAAALAAVLTESFRSLDGLHRVGVILSGGNVNLDELPW